MQHHMYTLDAQRREWEISLIDEDDLIELAYRGQVAEESLLYNTATENFTSAREHALLIGTARGLRMSCAGIQHSATFHNGAKSFGETRNPKKPSSLPRVPTRPATVGSFGIPPHPPLTPAYCTNTTYNGVQNDTNFVTGITPTSSAWEAPVYSLTDEKVESYIPKFRSSVRLQTVGMLTLPAFGLGLPLLLEGCRRRNAVLRLVEQTGMEQSVWLSYVGQRAAGFPKEQKALRTASAFVSAIAAVVVVSGISRAEVRAEIVQIAGSLKNSAPAASGHHHSSPRSRAAAAERAKIESDLGLRSVQ